MESIQSTLQKELESNSESNSMLGNAKPCFFKFYFIFLLKIIIFYIFRLFWYVNLKKIKN
jgi:hypothetical protein